LESLLLLWIANVSRLPLRGSGDL